MSLGDLRPIGGSELSAAPGFARSTGALDASHELTVTVQLRRRGGVELPDLGRASAADLSRISALSTKEFVEKFGAAQEDLDKTLAFARKHDLRIVDENRHPASWKARRAISLQGPVETLERLFGTQLAIYESIADEPFIGREGPISIHRSLAGIVEYVFGLDNRPLGTRGERFVFGATATSLLKPRDVASYYNFPSASGRGQRIALMEFGGGYFPNDVLRYFAEQGLAYPRIEPVFIGGQTGHPGTDRRSDVEVTTDICVAGSLAPDATLAVYFAPHTEQGWIDGISACIHNTAMPSSIVSISWGAAEYRSSRTLTWSRKGMREISKFFQDAATAKITVLASSGDNGASCGLNDRWLHVAYPASDPGVIACGGTSISGYPTPAAEVPWPSGGGGVSLEFSLPTYQARAGVPTQIDTSAPGRGVPDVSGYADPGFGIYYNGGAAAEQVPGTSLTAPLYAALFARINELLGRNVGYVLPQLYEADAFVDMYGGPGNGSPPFGLGYSSKVGWDAMTGLGRIDGTKLKNELAKL